MDIALQAVRAELIFPEASGGGQVIPEAAGEESGAQGAGLSPRLNLSAVPAGCALTHMALP